MDRFGLGSIWAETAWDRATILQGVRIAFGNGLIADMPIDCIFRYKYCTYSSNQITNNFFSPSESLLNFL